MHCNDVSCETGKIVELAKIVKQELAKVKYEDVISDIWILQRQGCPIQCPIVGIECAMVGFGIDYDSWTRAPSQDCSMMWILQRQGCPIVGVECAVVVTQRGRHEQTVQVTSGISKRKPSFKE